MTRSIAVIITLLCCLPRSSGLSFNHLDSLTNRNISRRSLATIVIATTSIDSPSKASATNMSGLMSGNKGRRRPSEPSFFSFASPNVDEDDVQFPDSDLDSTNVSINGVDYSTNLQTVTIGDSTSSATYDLPSKWQKNDSSISSYTDPSQSTTTTIASSITVQSLPLAIPLSSLTTVPSLCDALNLSAPRTSDVVSAAKRSDKQSNIYYEWDLAFSPKTCPPALSSSAQNFGNLGICPYEEIHLIRAVVNPSNIGEVSVFESTSSREGWTLGNSDVRSVRASFKLRQS